MMKNTDRKHKILYVSAILFAIVLTGIITLFGTLAGLFPVHPVITGTAVRVASSSEKFTPSQIRGALEAVTEDMQESGFQGCVLKRVEYNEKQSNAILAIEEQMGRDHAGASVAYDQGIAVGGISKVAIISVKYTCDQSSMNLGLNPGDGGYFCSTFFTGDSVKDVHDWKILDCGNG